MCLRIKGKASSAASALSLLDRQVPSAETHEMHEKQEKKKRRQIEREFGVPIAGEILDPSRWTQTALKKLPAEGRLDVDAVFGRRAPLVLDLGCGNGRFLIGSAVWRSDHDHFCIHFLPVV